MPGYLNDQLIILYEGQITVVVAEYWKTSSPTQFKIPVHGFS